MLLPVYAMRAVRKKSDAKAGLAKSLFVEEAWRRLPSEAKQDLVGQRCDPEEWVRTWKVDAPCMLEYAQAWYHQPGLSPSEVEIHTAFGSAVPGGWGREKARLDASLPFRRPVPPQRWTREVEKLDARSPVDVGWETSAEPSAAVPSRPVPEVRGDLLAPVAADPFYETEEQFLRTAAAHYRARLQRLEKVAPAETARDQRISPELRKHVDWLLQFQLDEQNFAQIAQRAELHGAQAGTTVSKAVKALATLIGLELRPARPGRPPKQRTGKP